jgi:hypothetical protein
MFQHVFITKKFKEKNNITFFFYKNVMIRNINLNIILDVIKFWKSIQANKHSHKKFILKSLFNVFYIFVKLDESSKMKDDVPNSTTQWWVCPRSLKNMLRSFLNT